MSPALAYVQKVLAPLRSNLPEHLVHTLNGIVPLIAYRKPEASPLKHLLLPQQRESVADAANSAILIAAASAAADSARNLLEGGDDDDSPVSLPSLQEGTLVSGLQAVLQQLSAVHTCSHTESGGYGEVFSLQKALLLAPFGQGG